MEKQHIITANVGQMFEIAVDDNAASTGYRWMAAHIPSCALLLGIDFRPPEPPMIGGSGKRIFQFVGADQGHGVIRIVLARAFEQPKTAEERVYEVVVSLAPTQAAG